MISDIALKELRDTADRLKNLGMLESSIGELKASEPIKIESINRHAAKQMADRGITEEQAQTYIDDSTVMFEQAGGSKRLYLSKDGNTAILVDGKRLLTAYPAEQFSNGMKTMVEAVLKFGKDRS